MKTIITLNNFDEDILEDLKAMIDILNERPLPIYKIVDRLPRKKDSNTIYIKEMKEKYIEYVWFDGKWHIVAEIKK